MKHRWALMMLALLALAIGGAWWRFLPSINANLELIEFAGNTMGGSWSVKVRQLQAGHTAESLQHEIAQLLDRLEQQMSGWRDDSEISRFNRQQTTDWIPVSAELADVIRQARQISEQTGGAFDITVSPLVDLWGFGPQQPKDGPRRKLPTDAEIAAARRHVGYKYLAVRDSPPSLRKMDTELTVDLGAIGKGFAADQVSKYLDAEGVSNYLIAIGGELRARGSRRKETSGMGGWLVGIETPTADVRRVLRTIELHDESLSTSGDYRNFIEIEGVQYCHEIDPRTGRPIEHGPACVSVVHPSGTIADGMATAMMVLGADRGCTVADQLPLAVLFITRSDGKFELRSSRAFGSRP